MRSVTGRRDDDDGAVAILVAILMSAVLLIVGALTVDLGSLWAARAGLSGAADAAALAAAALLPEDPEQPVDDAAVVAAAARVLCADGNRRPDWQAQCDAGTSWATDEDPANGDVSILRADPADYDLAVDEADRAPWIVVVRTPQVRVTFGLARAAGRDGSDVSASSGARRGLPYPAGSRMALRDGALWGGSPYSPYYVTVADLEAAQGVSFGRTCLRTLPRSGGTSPGATPPGDDGFAFGEWVEDDGAVVDDTDGNGRPNLPDNNSRSFEVIGASFGAPPPVTVDPADLTLHIGLGDDEHVATVDRVEPDGAGTWRIKFTTPDLRDIGRFFGRVPVWWDYDDGTTAGTSQPATSIALDYPPTTVTASSDCDPLPDGRGVLDASALDGTDSVADAVAGGLRTRLAPFGASPQAQQLPGRDVACDDVSLTTTPVPTGLGGEAPDGANCVPLLPAGAVPAADLTRAWLGTDAAAPGRLRSTCGAGSTGSISGLGSGFDQTNLFSTSSGLLATGVSPTGLRERIRAGLAADPEYVRAVDEEVFDCPRLLLVPVLDAEPPADAAVRQAVVGFTYFWVSDTRTRDSRGRPTRGLMLTPAGQVVGIRGWVVDPGYVRGGDWVPHTQNADDALPMSLPRRAVLVRTPCDGHPDSTCPVAGSPP